MCLGKRRRLGLSGFRVEASLFLTAGRAKSSPGRAHAQLAKPRFKH